PPRQLHDRRHAVALARARADRCRGRLRSVAAPAPPLIASDMRFEKSIEIAASQQRVWDVLTDVEAWPRRIETVDTVELLTPAPLAKGNRVRLRQPKL